MMAALLRRDADGQGQVVDTAMFEAALRLTGDLLPARTALGIRRERAGGDWPLFPAGATVEAGDGRFVAVSGASAGEVEAALGRLGRRRGDDPAAAREQLGKLVAALAADEAVARLRGAGLAATVVNSVADLVREPHCWSRGDLLRLDASRAGRDRHPGDRADALAHARGGWPTGRRGPAPIPRRCCASCWATRRSRSGSSPPGPWPAPRAPASPAAHNR